MKILNNIFET